MSESFQLYQSEMCGFCHRVRHYLAGAGIEIPLRDTLRDPKAREELVSGGGRATVPCLRIEREGSVEWLYESMDIIDYLQSRLSNPDSPFQTLQSRVSNPASNH